MPMIALFWLSSGFCIHMSIFLSYFVNKVDKKGRVSVPSPYRGALGQQSPQGGGVIVYRSHAVPGIEAFGHEVMERLVASADRLAFFSDARHDISAAFFADCESLTFDGEGRIALSDRMIAHADLQDQAAFVGCGSTFQIWNPEVFTTHQAEARQRLHATKGFGDLFVREKS